MRVSASAMLLAMWMTNVCGYLIVQFTKERKGLPAVRRKGYFFKLTLLCFFCDVLMKLFFTI